MVKIYEQNKRSFRNALEANFAKYLDLLQKGGLVGEWWYEPIKWWVLSGWYTADFAALFKSATDLGKGIVIGPDELVFFETKGFRRKAEIMRLKTANEIYPFKFILVSSDSHGWCFENARDCTISHPKKRR